MLSPIRPKQCTQLFIMGLIGTCFVGLGPFRSPNFPEAFTNPDFAAQILSTYRIPKRRWYVPVDPEPQIKYVYPYSLADYKPLVIHTPPDSNMIKDKLERVAKSQNSRVIELRVVYNVFFDGLMEIGRTLPFYSQMCPPSKHLRKKLSIESYDTVVLTGNRWTHNYYHFLIDTVSQLTLLNADVINNAVFLYTNRRNFMPPILKMFGNDNSRILEINNRGFAKRLYVFRGLKCHETSPLPLKLLRQKLVSEFQLDQVPPHIFAVHVRKSPERTILNIEEVMASLKKEIHGVEFVQIGDVNDLKEQMKLFNSIRVLISLHGANLVPTIIMQAGAVLCEIHGDEVHHHYACFARYFGLQYVSGRQPGIPHFKPAKKTLSCTLVVKLAQMALELL